MTPFNRAASKDVLSPTHHQLVSQAEQIFNASVQQLKRSLELYQMSQKLTGKGAAQGPRRTRASDSGSD